MLLNLELNAIIESIHMEFFGDKFLHDEILFKDVKETQ